MTAQQQKNTNIALNNKTVVQNEINWDKQAVSCVPSFIEVGRCQITPPQAPSGDCARRKSATKAQAIREEERSRKVDCDFKRTDPPSNQTQKRLGWSCSVVQCSVVWCGVCCAIVQHSKCWRTVEEKLKLKKQKDNVVVDVEEDVLVMVVMTGRGNMQERIRIMQVIVVGFLQ